jgi:hypothetical protein
MNTNYKDLLNAAGLTQCTGDNYDKNDCINEIVSLNCNNMEKLADTYSSQIKNSNNEKQFVAYWNDAFDQSTKKSKDTRKKLGKVVGTMNNNLYCFANKMNNNLSSKINLPDKSFENGLLEGLQSIRKMNVYIILVLLVILSIIIDRTVNNKNISTGLFLLLTFIAIFLVYFID